MKVVSKFFFALSLLAVIGSASATLVVSSYGDIDNGYDGSGGFGITDQGLGGSQSWTQTFSLPASETISSAVISIGTGALGFYPPSTTARLFLDGVLVGALTDTDACDGSAAPGYSSCGFGNYAIDLLSIGATGLLLDGVANMYIETGSGDGWFLDYSEITITTVPAPAGLLIFGAGLIGLGLKRSKALKV